jgi:hypothetical protein
LIGGFVDIFGDVKDRLFAILGHHRYLHDGMQIHGYVSVVKNMGRPDEEVICSFEKSIFSHNLVPVAGRDWAHAQLYTNTSQGTQGANFIAISADPADPTTSDTSLAGEITSGGLERAQATTISHVNGSNVTTLSKTFTATASFTNLHKSALFNNAGPPISGNMPHAAKFANDVGNMVAGDTLTITWTLTAG